MQVCVVGLGGGGGEGERGKLFPSVCLCVCMCVHVCICRGFPKCQEILVETLGIRAIRKTPLIPCNVSFSKRSLSSKFFVLLLIFQGQFYSSSMQGYASPFAVS